MHLNNQGKKNNEQFIIGGEGREQIQQNPEFALFIF